MDDQEKELTSPHMCGQSNEEINLLCQTTFMKVKQALNTLWVIVPFILAACAAVVGYGFTNSQKVTSIFERQVTDESRLNILETQVNNKLDRLIELAKQK